MCVHMFYSTEVHSNGQNLMKWIEFFSFDWITRSANREWYFYYNNLIIFIASFFLSPTSLQVSWMRKRDLHILTSDIHTYTGDQRFSVLHPPDSDDWDLKIEYAQQKDSGIYECQVNTEPKINLAILLDVTGWWI